MSERPVSLKGLKVCKIMLYDNRRVDDNTDFTELLTTSMIGKLFFRSSGVVDFLNIGDNRTRAQRPAKNPNDLLFFRTISNVHLNW